jgi:hypothetical protein
MAGYADEIRINKYQLAELWEVHQDLFLKYGEQHADAIQERDRLKGQLDLAKADSKDELDFVKSRLELEVLTEYKKFGFSKPPSDKLREAWVLTQKKYQDALVEYRNVLADIGNKMAEANHKVDVLKVVKEAFEHRKEALDNLTRLMVSGFYSAKLPVDLKEEVAEKRDRALEERSRERTSESGNRRLKRMKGED